MKQAQAGSYRLTLTWGGGILGIVLLFWFLAAGPQFARLREMTELIEREHHEITAGSSSPQSIALLQDEVARLARRTAYFEQQIPAQPELGELLQGLAEFALRHGLETQNVKPGPVETYADVVAQPLAMRLRGSFTGVYAMLRDIELMPRLTQIRRCLVTGESETGGSVVVDIEFRVFHQPGRATG